MSFPVWSAEEGDIPEAENLETPGDGGLKRWKEPEFPEQPHGGKLPTN